MAGERGQLWGILRSAIERWCRCGELAEYRLVLLNLLPCCACLIEDAGQGGQVGAYLGVELSKPVGELE